MVEFSVAFFLFFFTVTNTSLALEITCDKDVYYGLNTIEAVCNISNMGPTDIDLIVSFPYRIYIDSIHALKNTTYNTTAIIGCDYIEGANYTGDVSLYNSDYLNYTDCNINYSYLIPLTYVWNYSNSSQPGACDGWWTEKISMPIYGNETRWKIEWNKLEYVYEPIGDVNKYIVKNYTFEGNATFKIVFDVPIGTSGKFNLTVVANNTSISLERWWDTTWMYRRSITIDNTQNQNNLTDYQVLLTIDTASLVSAGKMRSDCGDIRFSYYDPINSTEIETTYWIESGCNSTSTKIWVKVPSVQANSTATIYMYYGNPSATSYSNGYKTFKAFNLGFDGPISGRNSLGGYHVCAILTDGTLKCWGLNRDGQLGDGTRTDRYTPVPVFDVTNVVAVATGLYHTCAIISDGTIKCWGQNWYGQLGDGTINNTCAPVTVFNITNAVAIATGSTHTCALLSDGTVKCWGYNDDGELGDGTTTYRFAPVTVSNLTNAVAIATGSRHTCALISDGTVKCWGNNMYGQLGDGTTTNRYTPVTVSNLTNVVSIALGYRHSCALLSDGTIKCWGLNNYGQLGDGTTTNSYTPVTVSNITNAVAIATGVFHTCALISDGTIKCWGRNNYGQLGDGTTTDSYTPVIVSNITNAVAMVTGAYHTCALLSDGTVKCWGLNNRGQLGDGTNTNRYTPVQVLDYSLGGKYEKTGGNPITIQRSPYFIDTYFVREYTYPDPITSVEAEVSIPPVYISVTFSYNSVSFNILSVNSVAQAYGQELGYYNVTVDTNANYQVRAYGYNWSGPQTIPISTLYFDTDPAVSGLNKGNGVQLSEISKIVDTYTSGVTINYHGYWFEVPVAKVGNYNTTVVIIYENV